MRRLLRYRTQRLYYSTSPLGIILISSAEKLQNVKEEIMNLKGKDIRLTVNKGRKKIVKFCGIIENVYPSMFIIKPMEDVELERTSFSYNDVLCGDISYKTIQ